MDHRSKLTEIVKKQQNGERPPLLTKSESSSALVSPFMAKYKAKAAEIGELVTRSNEAIRKTEETQSKLIVQQRKFDMQYGEGGPKSNEELGNLYRDIENPKEKEMLMDVARLDADLPTESHALKNDAEIKVRQQDMKSVLDGNNEQEKNFKARLKQLKKKKSIFNSKEKKERIKNEIDDLEWRLETIKKEQSRRVQKAEKIESLKKDEESARKNAQEAESEIKRVLKDDNDNMAKKMLLAKQVKATFEKRNNKS